MGIDKQATHFMLSWAKLLFAKTMKFSRYDRLLLILALALLLAMAATLLLRTGRSRHGYGSLPRQSPPAQLVSELSDTLSRPMQRCHLPDYRPPHTHAAPES
jgi:ABC-type nickel/cobalt efflux system permease component RcnA